MPGSRVPLEVGSEEYYLGSRIKYPNPFFSLANNYVPSNIKTLFRYCRGFFYGNGFIRNIVTKLTEYPITDILFDTKLDRKTQEKYEIALKHHIKIKQLLIEIGLDYYTFGNAFISANLGFKRYLVCTGCKEAHPINNIGWKFKNFSFHGTCPKCMKDNTPYKIDDKYIKSIEALHFIRWAPEQIEIEYDELTGESDYFYVISNKRKKQIIGGKSSVVAKTPKLFLDALKIYIICKHFNEVMKL